MNTTFNIKPGDGAKRCLMAVWHCASGLAGNVGGTF